MVTLREYNFALRVHSHMRLIGVSYCMNYLVNNGLVSLHIRSMIETICDAVACYKLSGKILCSKSPDSPSLEFQFREPPPPPLKMKIVRDFRFEVTKVWSRKPPPPPPKFKNSKCGQIEQSEEKLVQNNTHHLPPPPPPKKNSKVTDLGRFPQRWGNGMWRLNLYPRRVPSSCYTVLRRYIYTCFLFTSMWTEEFSNGLCTHFFVIA